MNTSESARNKWIAGGAIMVMLLAGGSIARLYSLQRQASPSDPAAQAAAINASLELSPEEQKRRLELVTRLRDAWKPWAQEHQVELQRMLGAKSSDVAARDAVWNLVPDSPHHSDSMADVSKALNPNGDSAKGEVFTWNAVSRPKATSQIKAVQPDVKIRYAQENAALKWALRNDFAEQRDVAISQSIQTGKVSVTLWVSGRVTEDTVDDRNLRSPEGFGAFTYSRRDLFPPYDFLTSNKGTNS